MKSGISNVLDGKGDSILFEDSDTLDSTDNPDDGNISNLNNLSEFSGFEDVYDCNNFLGFED